MPLKIARPMADRLLAAATVALLALAVPCRADVVDRVVLRVNDRIATLLDYESRRADMVSQLAASDLPEEQRAEVMANLGNRLFRDMLEELLLLSRADQLRVHPTEEEVDRAVDAVRQDFGITSDDEFAAALASQGISLAEFREQVRSQLRIRTVVAREVTSEIELEEDDLRRVYRADEERFRLPDRYQVRELIVLEAEERDPDEVRRLAESIHDELEKGRAFEELAAQYADRGLTSEVVELGWIEAGELDPTLATAIASLSPGEFSEPVPGRGGLHILELMEHEPARVQTFNEVAQTIEAQERRRLQRDKIQEYMRELEESAYVRAEPPPDAAGFRTVAGSRAEEDPFADFESVGEEPDVTPPTDRPEPERVEPPPGGRAPLHFAPPPPSPAEAELGRLRFETRLPVGSGRALPRPAPSIGSSPGWTTHGLGWQMVESSGIEWTKVDLPGTLPAKPSGGGWTKCSGVARQQRSTTRVG